MSKKRPTFRAQMKGEVKDAKKIGNALMGASEKTTTPNLCWLLQSSALIGEVKQLPS